MTNIYLRLRGFDLEAAGPQPPSIHALPSIVAKFAGQNDLYLPSQLELKDFLLPKNHLYTPNRFFHHNGNKLVVYTSSLASNNIKDYRKDAAKK